MEVPVAAALGLSAFGTLALFEPAQCQAMPQIFFAAMKPFNLIAIPFFIVAGTLLGRSGISKRLVNFADCLIGRKAGGIAIVTVVVSIFFAGISGSGPADVAALGLILIPAMVEAGFSKRFSAALMAAGGGIGIIVPPSIALILYGVVAQDFAPSVRIDTLFIAGIIPGIYDRAESDSLYSNLSKTGATVARLLNPKRRQILNRKHSARHFAERFGACSLQSLLSGEYTAGSFHLPKRLP